MPECGTVFPGVEVYTEEELTQKPLYWSRTARAHYVTNIKILDSSEHYRGLICPTLDKKMTLTLTLISFFDAFDNIIE